MNSKHWRANLLSKNPVCTYCRCKLELATSTIDHLIPRSKGGRGVRNIVLACQPCNVAKKDVVLPKAIVRLIKTHTHQLPPRGEL